MKRKSKLRFAIGHRDDAGIDITNKNVPQYSAIVVSHRHWHNKLELKTRILRFHLSAVTLQHKPLLVQSPCIDAGYTGEIHIWVRNLSSLEFTLLPDVSYFQLYVVKIRPWRKNEVVVENKHPRGNTRCTTR